MGAMGGDAGHGPALGRRGFGALVAFAALAAGAAPLRADGVCSLALGDEEDELAAAMDALSGRFFAALTTGGPGDVEELVWQPREFLCVTQGRAHRGVAALFDPRRAGRPAAPWSGRPPATPATTIGLADGVALSARPGPPAEGGDGRMRRLDVLVARRAPDGWRAVALIMALAEAGG